MRYAIVESGGKQYRAVEGTTFDVDRLPAEVGSKFNLVVLLMADGDEVLVGTPTVSDILVSATVLAHVKGPKVVSFKYRPKKRIRVKGGHRHQYTRLLVDFIGREGEERKVEKVPKAKKEVIEAVEVEAVAEKPAAKKKATAEKKPAAKKPAAKTAEKKPAAKKSDKK
jgi:large subunit ribosomal protein L21